MEVSEKSELIQSKIVFAAENIILEAAGCFVRGQTQHEIQMQNWIFAWGILVGCTKVSDISMCLCLLFWRTSWSSYKRKVQHDLGSQSSTAMQLRVGNTTKLQKLYENTLWSSSCETGDVLQSLQNLYYTVVNGFLNGSMQARQVMLRIKNMSDENIGSSLC